MAPAPRPIYSKRRRGTVRFTSNAPLVCTTPFSPLMDCGGCSIAAIGMIASRRSPSECGAVWVSASAQGAARFRSPTWPPRSSCLTLTRGSGSGKSAGFGAEGLSIRRILPDFGIPVLVSPIVDIPFSGNSLLLTSCAGGWDGRSGPCRIGSTRIRQRHHSYDFVAPKALYITLCPTSRMLRKASPGVIWPSDRTTSRATPILIYGHLAL
jgi:hypothetical protein